VSISGSTPITVTGSTTLPTVGQASVNINNTSGADITITLPVAAAGDQSYKFKDVAGNAQTYRITLAPSGGAVIDGLPFFYMFENYQAVELYWTGQWSVR
jgi:type II secretory pathway pseudopilin PulG